MPSLVTKSLTFIMALVEYPARKIARINGDFVVDVYILECLPLPDILAVVPV
jgi:hypothetical protein